MHKIILPKEYWHKDDIIKKIKDYDWNENHTCAYNDGLQSCECMEDVVDKIITIINKKND